MNFELTKTEQLFRQMIREFAENEVKPLAAEIDEEERFPVETVEKMAKLGIFGIPFPVNYGGAGGNNILYSMAVEELSRVCATTGVVVSAHTSLCAAPIYEHGTEEQKMKYLPKLCSGEWLGAFGLTEPNAGTDAAAQQTTAVDAGDHYILNGNKIFITNAAYAHVYIVMAMTDKSQGTRGISAFIVERDFPGFSIGKKEKKMGIRGSATCELIFENCIVPKENLLGKVGKGFSIAMTTITSFAISSFLLYLQRAPKGMHGHSLILLYHSCCVLYQRKYSTILPQHIPLPRLLVHPAGQFQLHQGTQQCGHGQAGAHAQFLDAHRLWPDARQHPALGIAQGCRLLCSCRCRLPDVQAQRRQQVGCTGHCPGASVPQQAVRAC